MKKMIFQVLLLVALFFTTNYVLQQIDWISLFRIEKITKKTEEKLGDLFWEINKKNETENKNLFVRNSIDSIVDEICLANQINRASIKTHLLNKDDVNAFALPNGHLIIYSGLLLNSDNQEELSGVICHEIAHIELNHVLTKLIKEVGLSTLISMTTGQRSSETIQETAKILTSSAFDRNLEKEADIKAVDYLIKSNINPVPFANFLFKLSAKENDSPKYLNWVSTHPESKERAEYILKYCKNKKVKHRSILAKETWDKIKEILVETQKK